MFLTLFMYFPDAFLFLDSAVSTLRLSSLSRPLWSLNMSYLPAGSPTTAHRNLTSNSLSDFSDKPEKDQVISLCLSLSLHTDDGLLCSLVDDNSGVHSQSSTMQGHVSGCVYAWACEPHILIDKTPGSLPAPCNNSPLYSCLCHASFYHQHMQFLSLSWLMVEEIGCVTYRYTKHR